MKKHELRFRQIHMDFHTSPDITPICEEFDAEEFAGTLKAAYVNSVTCFAQCHHGMLYYNSKKFPEMVHPGLKNKDLLPKQIEACHKLGIRVPIYFTVQWNHHIAHAHPEWLCLSPDGTTIKSSGSKADKPFEPGFYRTLCVNTPYRAYFKEIVCDALASVPAVDGVFFDIVCNVDCACDHCVSGMIEKGLDPEKYEDRTKYAKEMLDGFKREMSAFVESIAPGATVFYNCGHISPSLRSSEDAYSHWELESLPSGGWGYGHFVNTVRFARTTGHDLLGQTGKFHTAWGDFHSFKNIEALEYECFRMLAMNAKCLIGDQLDPSGKISAPVYDLVGSVYSRVAKKEPWCAGAETVVDIAIFTPEAFTFPVGTGGNIAKELSGAAMMLDEAGHQFDIVDQYSNFEKYKLLILPDSITITDDLKLKIESYISAGGKVLMSYRSGFDKNGDFSIDIGAEMCGEAPLFPDFIVPDETGIGSSLPHTEHVMYMRGMEISVKDGNVLLKTNVPYFNRTWQHFCSHKHTPSSGKPGSPAAVKKDGVIYFSHPVFSLYAAVHPKWVKTIVLDAIDTLMPERVLKHNGPTSLLATLNYQQSKDRYVCHVLHYIPERRGNNYTIEDIIPLYNITVSLNIGRKPDSLYLAPQNAELPFDYNNGIVTFTVPKIYGHEMISLEFKK